MRHLTRICRLLVLSGLAVAGHSESSAAYVVDSIAAAENCTSPVSNDTAPLHVVRDSSSSASFIRASEEADAATAPRKLGGYNNDPPFVAASPSATVLRRTWAALRALLVSLAAVGMAWLARYHEAMLAYPIVVKCLSSALVGMCGDTLAQGFERATCEGSDDDDDDEHEDSVGKEGKEGVNGKRGSKAAAEAAAEAAAQREELRQLRQRHDYRRMASVGVSEGVAGPLLHVCYAALERAFPTWPRNAQPLSHSVLHMAADTFLLDPIFIANAFLCSGLLEGKALAADLVPQLADELWPTTRASWSTSAFMSPVEYCIMSQVPPPYRVLAINANDIVWNALVSFFAHRRRRAEAERRLRETHRTAAATADPLTTAAATTTASADAPAVDKPPQRAGGTATGSNKPRRRKAA